MWNSATRPNFSVRDTLTAHKIVLVKDAVAKIEEVWTPEKGPERSRIGGLRMKDPHLIIVRPAAD